MKIILSLIKVSEFLGSYFEENGLNDAHILGTNFSPVGAFFARFIPFALSVFSVCYRFSIRGCEANNGMNAE